MAKHKLTKMIYVPEHQRHPNEYFNSFKEYKELSADRWIDEFGDERIPEYQCMTLTEFKSGIRDVKVV